MAVDRLTLRKLRQAAVRGELSACRALLRLYGHTQLAASIKAGRPIPPPAARMVRALSSGTSQEGEPLGRWEYIDKDGCVGNLLDDQVPFGAPHAPQPYDYED
jgi:hypothetical protein